jgi:hypothetical protein
MISLTVNTLAQQSVILVNYYGDGEFAVLHTEGVIISGINNLGTFKQKRGEIEIFFFNQPKTITNKKKKTKKIQGRIVLEEDDSVKGDNHVSSRMKVGGAVLLKEAKQVASYDHTKEKASEDSIYENFEFIPFIQESEEVEGIFRVEVVNHGYWIKVHLHMYVIEKEGDDVKFSPIEGIFSAVIGDSIKISLLTMQLISGNDVEVHV